MEPSPAEPCLVVGGGLIGSHVAIELADRGHGVTVLSRSFNDRLGGPGDEPSGIRLVPGDAVADGAVEELARNAEIVFFLAGDSTPALSDRDAVRSISALLLPVLATLDGASKSGTKRLVLASSGGTVYGRAGVLPTGESEPTSPISVHGVNCLASEEYASLFAREHSLEPIVLRFSNVYGPGGRARGGQGVIHAWCEAHAEDRPLTILGDGSVRRDFLFARDAAQAAIAAALGAPRPGTYNVGSGESVSLEEVVSLLERVSGRPPDLDRLEARAIDVPVTQLDSTRLREATGWSPSTSLEEGLRATWEWTLGR